MSEIGMANGGSEQSRGAGEGCDVDKTLGYKDLRVDSDRYKSCTMRE